MVVYANDPTRAFNRNQPQIEEGSTVRERQKIFSLPDLKGSMRVNTKVPESFVDQVRQGLRARIEIDAFPGESLAGVVNDVSPLPDSPNLFNVERKVYTTHVNMGHGPKGLRPGMNAHVEILVTELDNVISLPFKAVVRLDDKTQVAVKKPDGGFVWREVTLGLSTDKVVEIKTGLEKGDLVALDPLPLLTDEQRQKIAVPAQPADRSGVPRKATGKANRSRDPDGR